MKRLRSDGTLLSGDVAVRFISYITPKHQASEGTTSDSFNDMMVSMQTGIRAELESDQRLSPHAVFPR